MRPARPKSQAFLLGFCAERRPVRIDAPKRLRESPPKILFARVIGAELRPQSRPRNQNRLVQTKNAIGRPGVKIDCQRRAQRDQNTEIEGHGARRYFVIKIGRQFNPASSVIARAMIPPEANAGRELIRLPRCALRCFAINMERALHQPELK